MDIFTPGAWDSNGQQKRQGCLAFEENKKKKKIPKDQNPLGVWLSGLQSQRK